MPARGEKTRRVLTGAALLAGCLAAGPLAAQEGDSAAVAAADSAPAVDRGAEGADGPLRASPLLPADHWAVRAAARAEALGLAPGYFPAQRAVPRAAVAAAFDQAALRVPPDRPGLAALVEAWTRRFREEFPEHDPAARRSAAPVAVLGGSLAAGAEEWTGRLEPARAVYTLRVAPAPAPDRAGWVGEANLALGLGRAVALAAQPRVLDGEARLARWDARAALGPVTVAAGRQTVGYGPADGGGMVLSGAEPLPRVELEAARPVRLPWVLGALGPVSFHAFLSRMDEARHPGDPWLWGARVAVRPHPRLTAGLSRAAVFGGDSAAPATLRNVLGMLVGVLSDDFENQVVAVDVRYRLPTEGALPLTAYVEWGAEDAAGAWWESPGIAAGLFVPALPGLSGAAVGVEHVRFAGCCAHGAWYAHSGFTGNWVREGVPLGHPLGGEGSETRAYARAELAGARLGIDAAVFLRDRRASAGEDRGNLFTPARLGHSTGGSAALRWRFLPRAEAQGAVLVDEGDGWRERRLRAVLSYLF